MKSLGRANNFGRNRRTDSSLSICNACKDDENRSMSILRSGILESCSRECSKMRYWLGEGVKMDNQR